MTQQPAVLITGASTGIGHYLAVYLAARNYHVYATARKDQDLEQLATIDNVSPIRLDVRKPDQIASARDYIEAQQTGLHGLINNAGIGSLGLLASWSEAELHDIFDINVFGVQRVTMAFLPMLIAAQGRVINIGSQGGILNKPGYGPYTMTKHALEAYTSTLAMELEPHGVNVSIVQPGGVVSEILASSHQQTLERCQRADPWFEDQAEQIRQAVQEQAAASDNSNSNSTQALSSPEIVAIAVEDALRSNNPKPCYLVGTRTEGDRVLNRLIEKLLEENNNPQHQYSRAQLIELLDYHLQRQRRD
ncbi:MAG: oxidoreductase [Wenzhouxiangellaceae bacterium]